MKKCKWIVAVLLIATFFVFAAGSGESTTNDQGSGNANTVTENNVSDQGGGAAATTGGNNDAIGDYSVVIDSCRLAESYDDKPIVIVKYVFTKVKDDNATSFSVAFDDKVYQNGIGLNKAYFLDDSANYSADNQNKEIKKGATLEVEVAYELNDTTTDIEVEVKVWLSFNDDTIVKKFSIAN